MLLCWNQRFWFLRSLLKTWESFFRKHTSQKELLFPAVRTLDCHGFPTSNELQFLFATKGKAEWKSSNRMYSRNSANHVIQVDKRDTAPEIHGSVLCQFLQAREWYSGPQCSIGTAGSSEVYSLIHWMNTGWCLWCARHCAIYLRMLSCPILSLSSFNWWKNWGLREIKWLVQVQKARQW